MLEKILLCYLPPVATLALVALKLLHIISLAWVWLLAPLWGTYALLGAAVVISFLATEHLDKIENE